MDHRPQRCGIGDPEGQGVLGMRVHHRHHIGARFEDRGVNKALEIEGGALIAHRLAVEVELDDVLGTDQLRGHRTGDQKMVRVVRMSDADMAVGVDHLLLGEDAVGDHEVLDDRIETAHDRTAVINPAAPAAAAKRRRSSNC